jgi:hypothetical protein
MWIPQERKLGDCILFRLWRSPVASRAAVLVRADVRR